MARNTRRAYRDDEDNSNPSGPSPAPKKLITKGLLDSQSIRKPQTQSSHDVLRKRRLKLLGALIFSKLGGDATVEETDGGTLTVTQENQSWEIHLGNNGRVSLAGLDSGAKQFLGKVEDEDWDEAVDRISDNAKTIIDEDREKLPPDPPIKFPEDKPGEEDGEDEEESPEEPEEPMMPPVAPEGDQGSDPNGDPDMQAPDLGLGMDVPPLPGQAPPMQPPAAAPLPGQAPPMQPPAAAPLPGQAPPMQPPAAAPLPGQAPPMASRRSQIVASRKAGQRLAVKELESLGDDLEQMGFEDLAEKVDLVLNELDPQNGGYNKTRL
jgi:hypothetical protein